MLSNSKLFPATSNILRMCSICFESIISVRLKATLSASCICPRSSFGLSSQLKEKEGPSIKVAHPNYDNPFIASPDDYAKIERIDVAKAPRMQEMIKYMDIISNELAKDTAIMGFVYAPRIILRMPSGP